jgi:hypothetical protein
MKTNQPTRLPRDLPPHFFRHLISGLIVFALGLVADVTIVEIIHNRKHTVVWANGEVQRDFTLGMNTNSPAAADGNGNGTNGLELGYLDNGQIVWRIARPPAQTNP